MILRTPPRKRRPTPPPSIAHPSPFTSPYSSPSSKRPRLPSPPHQLVPFQHPDAELLDDLPSFRVHYDSETDDFDQAHFHAQEGSSMRCSYQCRHMVKSEVLETLDNQEKTILELSSKVDSLQKVADLAEFEKGDLLERVKRSEQELAASTAREKAVHEKFLLEMERAEERLRTQFKRCNELEIKLQQEMRHRAEAEAKVNAADRQIASLKDTAETSSEASKREILQLKESLRRAQKDADLSILQIQAESKAEKGRMQFAQAEAEALQAQCNDLKKRLSESLNEKRDLERKLMETSTSSSTSRDQQEMELMLKQMKAEIKLFEADVAEARRLKQYHVNADLLKEKLESERQRADRAETSLGDLADLQLQVKFLEAELQSWRNFLLEIPDVETRDDILRKISGLQREAMAATARVGELEEQLANLQGALRKEENAKSEAEINTGFVTDEKDEMALKVNRLEREVQLLIKERDGLKSIIASYDEEEAINMTQKKLGGALVTPERTKEKRIQELEALVLDLQREAEVLRSDLAKAEMRLGRGDFDPSSTKVLHMVENLDINSEKQALLLEIQNLREKLNTLQHSKLSSDGNNAEVASLREQINSLEKRETRFKKVFAEKISVFRQACCLLFGYTVQMNVGQHETTGMTITFFTLQSIYAQNDEEKLEFQFESNRMNLLANEYTSSMEIGRMVDVYLQKFNSIPAFTANLTSELFNKTTIG